MTTIDDARKFAEAAHAGQTRRYTGEPYIVHPRAVAEMVAAACKLPNSVAAAWLHDVVEDTAVTSAEIHGCFGHSVGNMVDWLTNAPLSAGPRRVRKQIDLERLGRAPSEVKTIKLADLADNAASIKAHDPKFWVVYQAECEDLLRVLEGGDRALHRAAIACILG